MKLEEQIALLNPQPGEHFSANYKRGGEDMRSVVLAPHLIPDYVDKLPLDADIWIGVNPVDHTRVKPGGRGTSRDVTRLTALFADLDVKEGGCDSYGKAMEIVCTLADILGEEPTMIVHSGHGMQPYWCIDPDERWTNPQQAALLTRWGGLVRIVAKSLGAQVDSVFDLARILRAVGTLNNKRLHIDGFAVEVTADLQTGGPLTLSQIQERLDEYGVPVVAAGSEDDFTGDSDPAGWRFAETTCQYVHAAVEAWRTDMPGGNGRHPWMHSKAIRLNAFHRNGCLTGERFTQAKGVLRGRFEEMCVAGIGGPARTFRSKEFADSMRDAAKYVGMMSDGRLVVEVNHLHGVDNVAAGPAAPTPSSSGPAQGHSAPFTVVSEPEPGPHRDDDDGPDEGFLSIFSGEQDFWSSRDGLKLIFEASLARLCSPWAVLGYCAARALALVPPAVTLPPIIGGKGSLNWFAALADDSGGGKSSAASVAKDLVAPPVSLLGAPFPEDPVFEANVGSGEGMIGQFYRPPEKKGDPPRIRQSVMFVADEVDNLTAMGQRQGSTTLPMIRTAFTGGKIGFSYIAKGRDVHVQAHTYRMVMIVNVQPERAAALFDDAGGGTPQRFMWFPANDIRMSNSTADCRRYFPDIPMPEGFADWLRYPMEGGHLRIPKEAEHLIISERVKAGQGRKDALDGHAIFCREKFAYALALLDGRLEMDGEDWRLSGIAAEISRRTREWAQAKLAESRVVEAKREGRIRGAGQHAASDEKVSQDLMKAEKVRTRVLTLLRDGPMSQTDLSRKVAGRDKAWLAGALDALSAAGLIRRDSENRWATG